MGRGITQDWIGRCGVLFGFQITNKTKADWKGDHPARLAETQTRSDVLRLTGMTGGWAGEQMCNSARQF